MSGNFFRKPKAVIVSPDIYKESVLSLVNMGINVLYSCENKAVMKPLAYHADMQIACVSPDTYVASPECYEYYCKILNDYKVKIHCGNTYLSCNYPQDIAYNITVTEKVAVHNFKYTDGILKSMLSCKKLINVSQGYTACTLCAISDTAFITSDAGIFKSLLQEGMHTLLINDDDVILPGFDHGFIGGSCFMADNKSLVVNGDAGLHRDYGKISEFCNLQDHQTILQ